MAGLEIDNKASENQIRPFAFGRKNWLFAASPNGASASALFSSLIATAKTNNFLPFDYLKLLFDKIPRANSNEDFYALLTFNLN